MLHRKTVAHYFSLLHSANNSKLVPRPILTIFVCGYTIQRNLLISEKGIGREVYFMMDSSRNNSINSRVKILQVNFDNGYGF